MAQKVILHNRRSNELRSTCSVMATLDYTDVSGGLISGDNYVVTAIPSGAFITDVSVVIETAFNGTTPTLDIGTTTSSALFENDLDGAVVAVTNATTGIKAAPATGIQYVTITPTLVSCTQGKVKVIINFIDTECTTGSTVTGSF